MLLFIRMKPNLKYIVIIKQKVTEQILKVALNTITWVWTKSLVIDTVTFRGIVNVEKIYCDFFSCDFLSLQKRLMMKILLKFDKK
jgi:hypothetical protein